MDHARNKASIVSARLHRSLYFAIKESDAVRYFLPHTYPTLTLREISAISTITHWMDREMHTLMHCTIADKKKKRNE